MDTFVTPVILHRKMSLKLLWGYWFLASSSRSVISSSYLLKALIYRFKKHVKSMIQEFDQFIYPGMHLASKQWSGTMMLRKKHYHVAKLKRKKKNLGRFLGKINNDMNILRLTLNHIPPWKVVTLYNISFMCYASKSCIFLSGWK